LEKPDALPAPIEDFSERRIVVLAPHFDDESIGCGGVISKHAMAGAEILLVYLTNGRRGRLDLHRTGMSAEEAARADDELSETRKSEARQAAQILGVKRIQFFDAPETLLDATPDLVKRVAEILRFEKPSVVYLPWILDGHCDHLATNRIFRAALCQVPPELRHNIRCRGYEISSPLFATNVADISDVIEIKRRAIESFPSQLLCADYVRETLSLNAYRSRHCSAGKGYAEAFFERPADLYCSILDAVTP
jgi:LmbE family N-acetylglucosaminyl deacetylase